MRNKSSHWLKSFKIGYLLFLSLSGLLFAPGGGAQTRVEITGRNYSWVEEVAESCLREAEYHFTQLTGLVPQVSLQLLFLPGEAFYSNQRFPAWSSGVCQGNTVILPDPTILVKKGILDQTLSHEFLHALLGSSGLVLPLWFEEGMVAATFPPSWPKEGVVDNPQAKEVKACYQQWINQFEVFKQKVGQESLPQFFSQVKEIGFESAFSAWMDYW